MADPTLEKLIPPIAPDAQVESKENRKKLERIFNKIIPTGVTNYLAEHKEVVDHVKNKLKNGESYTVSLEDTRYANDSIDFSRIWDRVDLTDETKRTLHKKILEEYIKLNGWVTQRDPERTYLNIWIDSKNQPLLDDLTRQEMYRQFLQVKVPKILEEMNLGDLSANDLLMLACGKTIDPTGHSENAGQLMFIKNDQGEVTIAQTIPSSQEFIFAATINNAGSRLDELRGKNLPLVIEGNDHVVELPGKRVTKRISFVEDIQNNLEPVSTQDQETDIDDELSAWMFDFVICDGYYTPHKFYKMLKLAHVGIDFEADEHSILDLVIKHVHQIKSEGLSFDVLGNSIGADLSGLSVISTAIKESERPEMLHAFTKVMQLWQETVANLYQESGYSYDELAGDGLNAFDFTSNNGSNPDKTLARINMAFKVQQSWNNLINSHLEDQEINNFIDFLKQNNLHNSFIKTAITEQSDVTLRWFSRKADVIPKEPLGPLLDEAKSFYQQNPDIGSIIVVSKALYESNQELIDQNFQVLPQSTKDAKGVIVALKNNGGYSTKPATPRDVLTAMAA